MNQPIGLLIVHGIGDQAGGSVAAPVVARLADAHVIADGAEGRTVWSIESEGRPVIVTEANWSDLSSPDNPPRIRVGWRIAYDSVAALAASPTSTDPSALVRYLDLVVRVTRAALAAVMLAVLVPNLVVGVLHEAGVLEKGVLELHGANGSALILRWIPSISEDELAIAMGIGLAVLLYLGGLVAGLDSRPRLREPERSLAIRIGRSTTLALWGAIVSIWTMVIQCSLVIYAVAGVVLAAILGIVLSFVRPVLSLLRPFSLGVWGTRLTWSVLILPAQVFLQFTWALSNLTSIVLVERRIGIAAIAVLYPPVLFIGLIVVLLVWEFFILIPLIPLPVMVHDTVADLQISDAPIGSDVITALISLLVFIPLILLALRFFVRKSLPIADLMLDVTSYLLASTQERHSYQARIEEGVERLRAKDCQEIHVLAHSLGSALVYDWLERSPHAAASVTTLHTIGSPLNKFWYLDHPRATRARDERDPASDPPRRWTNYWSRSDPVSGALRRYGKRVENRRLHDLGRFGVSHVAYWRDDRVLQAVRDGLRDPDTGDNRAAPAS